MYCKNCKREVEPARKMNWVTFLLLFFFGGIVGGFIYLLYTRVSKKYLRCPICDGRNWR